jgi:hypothetical protein
MEINPSSSHQLGETTTRIDYYPAGEIFLTLTQAYFAMVALGHLWDNLGTNFAVLISVNTLRDIKSARTIRTLNICPWAHAIGSPLRCTLYLPGSQPELSYSYSRSDTLV